MLNGIVIKKKKQISTCINGFMSLFQLAPVFDGISEEILHDVRPCNQFKSTP